MSTEQRTKQIWFLPWADIDTALSLGKVEIWPLSSRELKARYGAEVAAQLDKYFACYVDHAGKPVSTIAVCSVGNRGVSRISEPEETNLRFVVDILAFCTIVGGYRQFLNNPYVGHASADRFQLISQNFKPGVDDFAVSSGRTTSGGWKIDQIKFPQPWCIGGPSQGPDEELFKGFEIVFGKGYPADDRRRLARSLEWFRMAQTDAPEVSSNNKVVMLATAIECLLAVPKETENKQLAIAEWMDDNCTYSDSLKKLWTGSSGKEHSAIGHWARSFYDLRNSIVHGEKERTLIVETPDRRKLNHLHIASLVFWECVSRKLFNAGAFPSIHEALELFEHQDERKHMLSSLLKVSDVHRKLGWLPSLEVVTAKVRGLLETAISDEVS